MGLAVENDLAPAAWIEPRLRAGSFDVSMTTPLGFEAYARILFPFARDDIETAGVVSGREHITWTETARRNRRVPQPSWNGKRSWRPGRKQLASTRWLTSNLTHPMRAFYLLSGSHASYRSLPHDPNYWWPDDRSWCLCTDTDFCWAYLAGSADCVREVLAVPELDAYQTDPGNPARRGMDVINDPDGTVARYT